MIICVDFDGTCVTHQYPEIGESIGAEDVLYKLTKVGHKLILFTMRSGEPLVEAVNWFKKNEIELYGINRNPNQDEWTESPKAYGQIYIDDAAFGAPLIHPADGKRPYINWEQINDYFFDKETNQPIPR